MKSKNTLTIILFVVYALLLIGVVLFKLPFNDLGSERVINLIPFKDTFGGDGMLQFIENILIFVPLGIYLCTLKDSWTFAKKILMIVGVTVAFEIIQFIFALGRSDITDVIANALGGLISIGIYALLNKVFKEKTNAVINVIAIIVSVAAVLFFVPLLWHNLRF